MVTPMVLTVSFLNWVPWPSLKPLTRLSLMLFVFVQAFSCHLPYTRGVESSAHKPSQQMALGACRNSSGVP